MKGDIITILVAGAHLGGPNLYFPVEQCIYRRKSEGVYIRNPKRTWEKLLSTAHATVAIENPASVTVASSRNPRQPAVLQFAAAAPMISLFTPGASTNQTQAASRSQDSCELPTIGLCDTDSALHSGDDPFPAQGRSVGGSDCGCSPGPFCPRAAPFPANTREVASDRHVCTF